MSQTQTLQSLVSGVLQHDLADAAFSANFIQLLQFPKENIRAELKHQLSKVDLIRNVFGGLALLRRINFDRRKLSELFAFFNEHELDDDFLQSMFKRLNDLCEDRLAYELFWDKHYAAAGEIFRRLPDDQFRSYKESFLNYYSLHIQPILLNLEDKNDSYSYNEALVKFVQQKINSRSVDLALPERENLIVQIHSMNSLGVDANVYKTELKDLPVDFVFKVISQNKSFSVGYEYLDFIVRKNHLNIYREEILLVIFKNALAEINQLFYFEESEFQSMIDDEKDDLLEAFGLEPDEFDGDSDDLYTSSGRD